MSWFKDQWSAGVDDAADISAFFSTPKGLIVAGISLVLIIVGVVVSIVGAL